MKPQDVETRKKNHSKSDNSNLWLHKISVGNSLKMKSTAYTDPGDIYLVPSKAPTKVHFVQVM